MNVNIVRLKGVEKQLARIADALESFMAYNEVPIGPRNPDTSGEPPEVMYTDEVADFMREYKEREGLIVKEDSDE